jgi:hypothetical protein
MPTATNPETTGSLNRTIIMAIIVQIKTLQSSTTNGSNTENVLPVSRPNKMVRPRIFSRIEQIDGHLCFRINAIYEIIAATITAMTS